MLIKLLFFRFKKYYTVMVFNVKSIIEPSTLSTLGMQLVFSALYHYFLICLERTGLFSILVDS